MNLSRVIILGCSLLAWMMASSVEAAEPPARAASLASLLADDGTLALPAGFSGKIDPKGWSMVQAKGQPLRFAPDLGGANTDKLFGVPGGCNGHVFTIAVAPSGLIYLGGNFVICEEVLASLVVAYDPRSRRFFSLGNGATNGVNGGSFGAVYGLALLGDDLIVAGDFDLAGGQQAKNIARWDGSAWSTLGSGDASGTEGLIYDVVTSGNDVYVGGLFSHAGEVEAASIARWNGSVWSALGSGVGGAPDAQVYALAVSGSDVFAGGDFTLAGGGVVNNVARWNGTAWSGLTTGVNGRVNALAVAGSNLYVGGNFSQAGGQPASAIARWNGTAWSVLGTPADNGVDGEIVGLTVSGNDVYAGGYFNLAGGQPANFVARWNGSTWSGFGADGANGVNNSVFALALAGGELFVGGYFDQAGGQPANFVASFVGNAWRALGAGAGNGVNNSIHTLAVSGDDLYAGGTFTQAGGQPANRIARWTGSTWVPLGTGDANGVGNPVLAMATLGNDLYAGGAFRDAGGQPVNFIGRWNGSAWSAVGGGVDGSSGSVLALLTVGNDLYVGGEFILAGGQTANKIARWNGTSWSSLGTGAANGVTTSDFVGVEALASLGSNLYVGGGFRQAGGQSANFIARWDGTSWFPLGAGEENGLNNSVSALAVIGSDLYAGGRFSGTASGLSANGVARWNGSAWSSLGAGDTNGVNGAVLSMVVIGTKLYVGGAFTIAGGQHANGLAVWDGNSWTGLSNDAPPQVVRALVSDGSSLYAGGAGLTQTPLPDLQSRALNGLSADGASDSTVVSRVGTVLGFTSAATNLVAGDSNGRTDVFVRDRILGTVTRASAAAETVHPGANESFADPALSADGSKIAFSGSSGQLYVASNGVGQLLSRSAAGVPGNALSGRAFLAGPGTLAFFDSQASNLLSGTDGNGSVADIFVKNLDTGALTLISRGPNGEPANGPSSSPSASDDGQTIVFHTLASNITSGAEPAQDKGIAIQQAMMMRGGGFGQTRLYLSRNLSSSQLGNGHSTQVKITPDGRYGVFESLANNLVPGDDNNASDVFRFEIGNNSLMRLERISTSRHGFQANGPSKNATISDDGQFVVFETDASNLIELDRNDTTDILVKWMVTGELLRLSRTTDGEQPNGASTRPTISGDGTSIVFASRASNFSGGDGNNAADIFAVSLRGSGPVNPTGAWYDPAQDGHGLQVQLLGTNRILAFWYTFDPAGNRAYFIGDGPFDGSSATLTNLRPVGSFFPPNFNTSQIVLQPFGTMRLSFDSCSAGTVDFDLPQGFGQGSMRLARLTQPAGVLCGGTAPTTTATGAIAAATGAWYNPAQDGHGLVLESLGGGLLLATWYTQAPSPAGGQSWFLGVGTISGNSAFINMTIVDGGRFIPNFNPAAIVRRTFGAMTVRIDSCSAGNVSWSFGDGYGNGSMPLTRITAPAGVVCTP